MRFLDLLALFAMLKLSTTTESARRFCAVACAWLLSGLLIGASCAAGGQPADQFPAPQIVKPYVKGEMPTAEELLSRCSQALHEAGSWTAKVTLRVAAAKQAGESYEGTLAVSKNRLRGSLRSSADKTMQLRLLLSDRQGLAWWEPSERNDANNHESDADRARLEHVATTLNLLGVVEPQSNNPRLLPEIAKDYQFSNQGVANAGTDEVYVLEATRSPDDKPSTVRPAADARLLIGIAKANYLPTQVSSQSADGGWRSIALDSVDLKASPDEPLLPEKPSAGAVVLGLGAEESPADLKNPVPYGPESIARGRRLYRADCVVCHSIDGTGRDSDVTDNAADLTDTRSWLSDGSEAATFLAIRDGAGDEMPGYKDEYGNDQAIWDLVNYIRSLQQKK